MIPCNDQRICPAGASADALLSPVSAPLETLREVVRRHGTPVYAYDLARIREQIVRLKAALPMIDVLYSLKANPSLGLCAFIAGEGLGMDVASAGELVIAREAGVPSGRILVSGPDKSPAVLEMLPSVPEAVISLDSVSELELLARRGQGQRALLRLRPDFCSFAHCSAGPGSRFGLILEDVPRCREHLAAGGVRVVGFHVFAGSQVLDAAGVIHHLKSAVDQSLRAADVLQIAPEIIDMGGGFGIPYGPGDGDLDLAAVAGEMAELAERVAPARLVVELGRYIVAPGGWYLTSVIGKQTHGGRAAVVVDGGSHQRGDLCGLGLRQKAYAPVVLDPRSATRTPTDVLGCLSLPGDVLAEARPLPAMNLGDVLAFPNAGAYGLGASPFTFHGHPAPAEVAFEGTRIDVLRARQPVRAVLDGQMLLSRGGREDEA